MLKILSIAVLASLAVACGADKPRVSVAVEGNSFDRVALPSGAGQLASVPFTVTNRGGATAFVTTCGPQASPVIDRWTGSEWEQYSAGFCALDMISEPLELRDGESHAALAIFSEPGRYRIQVLYSTDGSQAAGTGTRSFPSDSFDVR